MSMQKAPIPPSWQPVINQFEDYLKAAGLRPATIKTRTDWLRRFARSVDMSPCLVTSLEVMQYAAAHDWKPETRRSVYASLKAFYRWMLRAGFCDADPTLTLPRVKPDDPKPRPAPPVALRHALTTADERTRLILFLAAYAGLRRGEIAQLHARDMVQDLLGVSLIVHGKGGKQRTVPIDDLLAADVKRAANSGYVFPGHDCGHLSPRYVGKLAAAVLPDPWTLHTLRHAFATAAYSNSKDLLAVQALLGHSSPATTRRYIQMPDERLRAVAAGARAA